MMPTWIQSRKTCKLLRKIVLQDLNKHERRLHISFEMRNFCINSQIDHQQHEGHGDWILILIFGLCG